MGDEGDEGDVTFFGEESNKEPVCDIKATGFKLKDGSVVCLRGRRKPEPPG